MKICKVCSIEKVLDLFEFRKDTGKHRAECSECRLEKTRLKRLENLEEARRKGREYRDKNKERAKEIDKKSRSKNHDKVKERQRNYYHKNKEIIRKKDAKRYKENASRNCKRQRDLYQKDRENRLAYRRKYVKENRGKITALARLRELTKIQATPKWLTDNHKEEMSKIYENSLDLTKNTGIEHNVDHIIPLRNDIVCGLHVPWNLQILTKEENSKKSNKLLQEYIEC